MLRRCLHGLYIVRGLIDFRRRNYLPGRRANSARSFTVATAPWPAASAKRRVSGTFAFNRTA